MPRQQQNASFRRRLFSSSSRSFAKKKNRSHNRTPLDPVLVRHRLGQLVDQLLQRRQLPLIDQIELLHEEDEVLERRVQVRLLAEAHHLLEVLVVDVRVHAEQPLQDRLGDGQEVLREGHADLRGEQRLVVQLVLHPRHQVVNVLGGAALDRLLDRLAVGPVVLVLGAGGHDAAAVLRAELGDGAVQHVDLVEEVDGWWIGIGWRMANFNVMFMLDIYVLI